MNDAPLLRHGAVCWQPNEIQPYESIWSIIHKFCLWNMASTGNVFQLFAVSSPTDPLIRKVLSPQANLHNPRWLDRAKIQGLLNLSNDSLANAFLERYSVVRHEQAQTRRDRPCLRYCPSCITLGYHSPIHLLPFVTHCPIHFEPLLRSCPSCSKPIPYSIPDQTIGPPYTCECGYRLWQTVRSAHFSDAEIGRLRAVLEWIDAVAAMRLKIIPFLRRGGSAGSLLDEDIANLAGRAKDLNPTLVTPAGILSENNGVGHSVRRSTVLGGDVTPDEDAIVLAVYKAIARRFTRAVASYLQTKFRSRRFSMPHWLASRSAAPHIALLAWKIYWQGCDNERSVRALPCAMNEWRANFLYRYRKLYARQSPSVVGPLLPSEVWRLQHLAAVACLGTFAECLRRSTGYTSINESSTLAAEITGEDVSVCVTESDGQQIGASALHLWTTTGLGGFLDAKAVRRGATTG
jgi:hypothetical protein